MIQLMPANHSTANVLSPNFKNEFFTLIKTASFRNKWRAKIERKNSWTSCAGSSKFMFLRIHITITLSHINTLEHMFTSYHLSTTSVCYGTAMGGSRGGRETDPHGFLQWSKNLVYLWLFRTILVYETFLLFFVHVLDWILPHLF